MTAYVSELAEARALWEQHRSPGHLNPSPQWRETRSAIDEAIDLLLHAAEAPVDVVKMALDLTEEPDSGGELRSSGSAAVHVADGLPDSNVVPLLRHGVSPSSVTESPEGTTRSDPASPDSG